MRPKQPITSPGASRGSHRSFCSSEPHRQIANIASEPCTETALRMLRVAGLELEAGQAVRDGARARQAVAVEVHPEQAELRELAGSPRAGRMPCSNQSPTSATTLLAHELPHRVADRALLVVEQRVDREEVERVEGLDARWSSPCVRTSYGRRASAP